MRLSALHPERLEFSPESSMPSGRGVPAFPKREGGREGGRSGHHTLIPSLLRHGGEDPAAGWALEGEAKTGECTRCSDVQTPGPRGARVCGPRSGPSNTPGLSLLNSGAHLRPVPAAPSLGRFPKARYTAVRSARMQRPRELGPGRAWAATQTRSRASAGTAA